MKSFNVPAHYRSPLVTAIKESRRFEDKLKKDFTPTFLKIGRLEVILARHFGFCYGVENAIEIAFRAVAENPGKRIYLLSEMIHNPGVNSDLEALGVRFIMDTKGNMLMNWDELTGEDIIIIPAFGTTLELEEKLRLKGIEPSRYETTCPFVEKVWNRAEKIGKDGYTIIVHGKPNHEETRATFSHSKFSTPTVIVADMEEAHLLAKFISGERPSKVFYHEFEGQYSKGFDVGKDFKKIGVVNQTTMLASETQAISDYLKGVVKNIPEGSFADTRDTLCYATNDNQSAVQGMLQEKADMALVIGGYNSSNTSHLVELCEEKLPTYFIRNEDCLVDEHTIHHFSLHSQQETESSVSLVGSSPLRVMITSGASCPDALVERVIERLAIITGNESSLREVAEKWNVELI